jgi:dTDP-4-amino-4,6-dideoxygalactose transaminase
VSGKSEVLAVDGGPPVSEKPVRFPWPILTSDLEERLVAQARKELSIYDRSGVVEDFEEAFSRYTGIRHCLATSSGTAALFSIYYGLGLGYDDEVVVCDYGFFATVTPLLLLGARPVFVDCAEDGNISAGRVAEAISRRTKAIVVTHMWGAPAALAELKSVAARHGLALVEDCSHAHGARFGSDPVGAFGRAAAWSLQAGKTLWAGEGGVLATPSSDVFERALLVGHFNARALQDIPPVSPNYPLAFTGTGLKFRAHPLGLALASAQLPGLDDLVHGRQAAADVLTSALDTAPGIRVLSRSGAGNLHSYYALVALVDPAVAGFDREGFVAALRAENILSASIPGQMGSISRHGVFSPENSRKPGRCERSEHIERTAVKFFVPHAPPGSDDYEKVDVVAAAIRKVAGGLRRSRQGGPDGR